MLLGRRAQWTSEPTGRKNCRIDYGLIARTAAQVARYCTFNLGLGGRRVFSQQFGQGGEHARCTKSTLKGVTLRERLLQHRQGSVFMGQAFNSRYFFTVGLNGQKQTRSHGFGVQEHRAGPTNTVLTAVVCSGQTQIMAQEVPQGAATVHIALVGTVIDRDFNAYVVHDRRCWLGERPIQGPFGCKFWRDGDGSRCCYGHLP